MTKPPEDLHTRIADALARLSTLARSREQRESSAETVSPLQARALVSLLRGSDQRVGEVANDLMVTYGTVSVALKALEEKALVTKFQDPDEHRAVRIELTRTGRAMAKRATGWTADVFEPAIAELPTTEAGALLATLLKLILSLERDGTIARSRMCVSCKYFVPNGGRSQRRPHFCRLLETPIGDAELRIDCPEHARADEPAQRAAARALGLRI